MNSETLPAKLIGESPEIQADRFDALMRYQARVFDWRFCDYVKASGCEDVTSLNALAITFATAVLTCARSEFPETGGIVVHVDTLTTEEYQAVNLLAEIKNTATGKSE